MKEYDLSEMKPGAVDGKERKREMTDNELP